MTSVPNHMNSASPTDADMHLMSIETSEPDGKTCEQEHETSGCLTKQATTNSNTARTRRMGHFLLEITLDKAVNVSCDCAQIHTLTRTFSAF